MSIYFNYLKIYSHNNNKLLNQLLGDKYIVLFLSNSIILIIIINIKYHHHNYNLINLISNTKLSLNLN